MNTKGIAALLVHIAWLAALAPALATHLQGSFDTQDFFKFLVKFGFQKAEIQLPKDSFGYIYGNITAQTPFHQPITLAVLDRSTFVEFYNNRSLSVYGRDLACQHMFKRVTLLAYDSDCNAHGKRDFLRKIPCPKGQLCEDEDAPSNVIKGQQFTYVITEVTEPR